MNVTVSMDEATLSLAASTVDRAVELIRDGWIKGTLVDMKGGAPVSFCIHGAVRLALEEIFGADANCGRAYTCGGTDAVNNGYSDVESLASAFITEEAGARYAYNRDSWKKGGLAAAAFNDAPERKHEEVLEVMQAAAKRLWDISTDTQVPWTPSQWADTETNEAQNYLHASLA